MKYCAFFRGINVGGKNKVLMKDLVELFVDLGFTDVKTYIQSGNVVFSTDNPELIHRIEGEFVEKFGFFSKVFVRNKQELSEIVSFEAFSTEEIDQATQANPDVVHQYVYLSNQIFDKEVLESALSKINSTDSFYIIGSEINLLTQDGIHKSKLAAAIGKLEEPLTARNTNTLKKILERM